MPLLLDIKSLKRDHEKFLKLHHGAIEAALDDAQDAGLKFARTKPGFTKRTGKTQAKTKAKVIRRGGKTIVMRMTNSAKHAAVLEKGSKPHVIKAKPGKTLRFWGFGRLIYRKQVKHPGTKAYRFLSRSRNTAGMTFERSMKPRMARAARSF